MVASNWTVKEFRNMQGFLLDVKKENAVKGKDVLYPDPDPTYIPILILYYIFGQLILPKIVK